MTTHSNTARLMKITREPDGRQNDAYKLVYQYQRDNKIEVTYVGQTEPILGSFKNWVDLNSMKVRDTHEFALEDRPVLAVQIRGTKPIVIDVQIDYSQRAAAIDKLMQKHGIPQSTWNTHEQRTKNRTYKTTAEALAAMLETYVTKEETVTAPATTDEAVDLDEVFPRDADNKPADVPPANTDKAYRKDVKQTIHAMPAHIKKVLGEESGVHIRNIFKMSIDVWLEKNSNDLAKAWQMCDEYIDGILSLRLATAENADVSQSTQSAPISHDVKSATDEPEHKAPVQPAPIAPTPTPIAEVIDTPPAPASALATVFDTETGEVIDFDPNRAITVVKASKALVDRMYQDKILVKDVDYGAVPGTDKATLLKPGAEKLLSAFRLYPIFKPTTNSVNDWKNGIFNFEYECVIRNRDTGKIEGSGIGSCNSMEKKYRWRWVEEKDLPEGTDKAKLLTRGGKIFEFDFAIKKAETTGKYGKPASYWKQFTDAIAAGMAEKDQRDTKNGKSDGWTISSVLYRIQNDEVFDLINTISKMAQKRALVAATLNATGASAVFTQDMEDFADYGMIDAA